MKIDAAYYYGTEVLKKNRDIIPEGYKYFVLSAGYSKPITRPSIHTLHPQRRDYQLIYACDGPIHYFDKEGTEHILPAGSILIYKPYEYQNYIAFKEENASFYWCHFGGSMIEEFLKNHKLFNSRTFVVGDDPIYCNLIISMRSNLLSRKKHFGELGGLYLRELLIAISHEIQSETFCEKIPENLSNVLGFIQDHYQGKLTVSQLCKVGMTNRKTLSKLFLEYCGETTSKYIMDYRLEKSKTLLLQTNHKINEIALSVGFQDPLYFSSAFKKEIGISPREYRNKNK